jgi:hypothetical protein
MVTRFTATEARQSTELAKQKIANEKKNLKVAEIEKAKELAAIEAGWKLQSEQLLKAAVDGETSLKFEEQIFNFQHLISLGFIVSEEGVVYQKVYSENAAVDSKNLEKAKQRIFKCFDLFIDASKSELSQCFNGVKEYHAELYTLLQEHINGDYDDFPSEDDDALLLMLSEMDEFSGCDVSRFKNELIQIEKSIKSFKTLEKSITNDDFELAKSYGQLVFSESDDDLPVLKPSEIGNFLLVSWWSSTHDNFFLNDPLLSVDGLSWLSGKYGQQLMASIFDFLRIETDKGKRSAILKFEMFNAEGWFFVDARGMDVYSCVPDEIPMLIESDGFALVDTTSTKSKYTITVSW